MTWSARRNSPPGILSEKKPISSHAWSTRHPTHTGRGRGGRRSVTLLLLLTVFLVALGTATTHALRPDYTRHASAFVRSRYGAIARFRHGEFAAWRHGETYEERELATANPMMVTASRMTEGEGMRGEHPGGLGQEEFKVKAGLDG